MLFYTSSSSVGWQTYEARLERASKPVSLQDWPGTVHLLGITHSAEGSVQGYIDGAAFGAPAERGYNANANAWSRIGAGGYVSTDFNGYVGTLGAVIIAPAAVDAATAARVHDWAVGRFGVPCARLIVVGHPRRPRTRALRSAQPRVVSQRWRSECVSPGLSESTHGSSCDYRRVAGEIRPPGRFQRRRGACRGERLQRLLDADAIERAIRPARRARSRGNWELCLRALRSGRAARIRADIWPYLVVTQVASASVTHCLETPCAVRRDRGCCAPHDYPGPP